MNAYCNCLAGDCSDTSGAEPEVNYYFLVCVVVPQNIMRMIIEVSNRLWQNGVRRMLVGLTFRMLLSSTQLKRSLFLLLEFEFLISCLCYLLAIKLIHAKYVDCEPVCDLF